jgi:hypothetical protein
MACMYVAHGGTSRNPLGPASELAAEGKVNRLIVRRLQLDRKARALIEGVAGNKEQDFLRTVFFGGGDGTSR